MDLKTKNWRLWKGLIKASLKKITEYEAIVKIEGNLNPEWLCPQITLQIFLSSSSKEMKIRDHTHMGVVYARKYRPISRCMLKGWALAFLQRSTMSVYNICSQNIWAFLSSFFPPINWQTACSDHIEDNCFHCVYW